MSSVAVIGHGRSPEGKGWGRKIDECVVIRMWDWHWQAPQDYGERYDYGVFSILPVSSMAFDKAAKRTPDVGWLGYARGQQIGGIPGNTTIIDQRFRDIAKKYAPGVFPLNLTRGCAAAAWALDCNAWDEVILVGFDNVRAGICLAVEEAFAPDYLEHYDATYPQWRRGGWYSPGQSRCGSHFMGAEAPMLAEVAEESGTKLSFAEDTW